MSRVACIWYTGWNYACKISIVESLQELKAKLPAATKVVSQDAADESMEQSKVHANKHSQIACCFAHCMV